MNYFLKTIFIHFILSNDVFSSDVNVGPRPHVILIVADDLGWNDVGFHGSSQIPTLNIDSLAYSGIILNNYYVNPICTPSRSALMTGKYPIHTGMQHGVLDGAEARGLPLTEKLLPEYLGELGYRNHIVGKWHLGSYKKEYTPLYRGFRSHIGFWIGHQDYFDHTSESFGTWGLDMRKNMDLAKDLHGKYSTDLFTQEAVKIINNHNNTSPLFLYLAHAAVHSGNSYNPLPAPDSYIANFSYIKNYSRQRFSGMLAKLDESIGELIHALSAKSMLSSSIIIFTTDNGGPAAGFNMNAASNYPLRGVKDTLWEGGIRGCAFIWSTLLQTSQRVSRQMMHITDWLPTILEAVGGNNENKSDQSSIIDGQSMWKMLSQNGDSTRNEILHNIDDYIGIASIIHSKWKYIKGESYSGKWSNWYGPSGRNYSYNFRLLKKSKVYKALKRIHKSVNVATMKQLRKEATVECKSNTTKYSDCIPKEKPCLFNIYLDPCEKFNVAELYPNILAKMKEKLRTYNKTAVLPGNLPRDPRGDPKNWDYAWVNFGDFI